MTAKQLPGTYAPDGSLYITITNGSGTLVSAGDALTIGTTTVGGGTTGRVLYDNAGAVGEYPITGTTNVVLSNSPTLVTPVLGAASATSITVPTVYGGSAVSSTLSLISTSGTGSSDAIIASVGTNGGTESFRIPTGGQLVKGYTASVQIAGNDPAIQVHGTSGATAQTSNTRWSADTSGAVTSLAKSRGASIGTNTVAVSGDTIGELRFYMADGTGFIPAAILKAKVDGTPGTNDAPGRLEFLTTLDGASSATLRMSIFNDGGVLIGSSTTSPGAGILSTGAITASGSLTFTTANVGPIFKQGSNGRVGTFVLNGSTPVTVSNTSVAITDAIIFSLNTVGGVVGVHPTIATITAGTGFTVAGTAADTSTYNYAIIKNAA